MTQPVIQLPLPVPPVTTRVIALTPFPGPGGGFELLVLTIDAPNPLASQFRVVRMLPRAGGVDVYSLSADGRGGVRHFIHSDLVRIIEESMPANVLVEEIIDAETEEDDEEEEEGSGGEEPGNEEPGVSATASPEDRSPT